MPEETTELTEEELNENYEKMASEAYHEGFAEELSARGYGFLVDDEESLDRAYKAAQKLVEHRKSAERQERPVRAAVAEHVLTSLLEE